MNKTFTVSFALCLLLLPGCGKKASSPAASTPKEAVAAFGQALYEMDKEKFLACFTGNKDELRAIECVANFGAAALSFKKKLIEVYGEEEWLNFQSPGKAPKEGNTTLNLMGERELEALKSIEIRIEGDKAYFPIPNESREAVLVRKDDGWRVLASSLIPSGTEPKAFAKMVEQLAFTVGRYEKAIGYKNLTREDIDAELGRAMMKIMTGISTPVSHRFDIEKIK